MYTQLVNLETKTKIYVAGLLFFVVTAAVLIIIPQKAGALDGFIGTSYPDNSNSSRTTWMISELCPSTDPDKCMKGAKTYAEVYVPEAQTGSVVTLNIIDGCDERPADEPGGRDTYGYIATTYFGVLTTALTATNAPRPIVNSSASSCSDATPNLSISFTAVSSPGNVPGYNVYYLEAVATPDGGNPDGWSWYLNHYRLEAVTAGMLVGVTDRGFRCPTSGDPSYNWPYSCPTTTATYTTISAYDRSGTEWSQEIAYALPCSVSADVVAPVIVYDPDDEVYQSDMRITVIEYDSSGNQTATPINNVAVDGGDDATQAFSATYRPNYRYKLILSGVGDLNSIQVYVPFKQVNASITCTKIKDVACSLSGPITVVRGGTFNLPVVLDKTPDDAVIADGSDAAGLHLGIAELGNPSTWNDPGSPTPPPDRQTTFIPLDGGLTNATYYAFDSDFGGLPMFNYKRYWVDSMAANDINNATLRIQAPSTAGSGSKTLVVRILDRAASRWEGTCQVQVNVVEPMTVTVDGVPSCTALVFTVNNASSNVNINLFVDGVDRGSIFSNVSGGQRTADISSYRDFGSRSFDVRVAEIGGAGQVVSLSGGARSVGPCASVTCGNINFNPSNPGSGDPVEVSFTFNVVNGIGANGRTYNYGASVAIPGFSNTGALSAVGGLTIGAGMSSSGALSRSNMVNNSRGTYTTTVTVTGLNPSPLTCTTTIDVADKPYVRFYGNDVYAGGGFGERCSASNATANVRASGLFTDTTNLTQGNYRGAASELAVFALGQIEYVMAGAQRDRTSPKYLSFANTVPTSPASGFFGGGFSSVYCADDYLADRPATPDSRNAVNLAGPGIVSGTYSFDDGVELFTGTNAADRGIVNGARLVVYVNGDVRLRPNGSNTNFGFLNTSWNSLSEVPSIYVIATGNIYIDSGITTSIDAVLIAQPEPLDPNYSTKGQIFTCAGTGINENLVSANGAVINASFLTDNCATKLTVNGAFVAKRVHLLRTLATVRSSIATPFEGPGSPTTAEVFRFSPELYLTEGGGLPPGGFTLRLDSLVSLPPSL